MAVCGQDESEERRQSDPGRQESDALRNLSSTSTPDRGSVLCVFRSSSAPHILLSFPSPQHQLDGLTFQR